MMMVMIVMMIVTMMMLVIYNRYDENRNYDERFKMKIVVRFFFSVCFSVYILTRKIVGNRWRINKVAFHLIDDPFTWIR